MNPPAVLADQEGASNAAETRLKSPVVLADQEGTSNAVETGLSVQSPELYPVNPQCNPEKAQVNVSLTPGTPLSGKQSFL